MSLNLLIKIKLNNTSWKDINEVLKKYINRLEFFPVNEKLTNNYKALGVSVPLTTEKTAILSLFSDVHVFDAEIIELYNGNSVTQETLNDLFND